MDEPKSEGKPGLHRPEAHAESDDRGGLSRRGLLTAAGATALAAGAAVALPEVVEAKGTASRAPSGTTAAEFVAQIAQNGNRLIAYGYFTRIAGVAPAELFDGVPGEATARYTAYAQGDLVSRAVTGPVTVLDVVGTLRVFHRETPGADSANPDSFRVGRTIARFDLTLQDVLTVIAPDTGLPTLAGDMKQTSGASAFGRRGARLRLSATGHGTRTEATAPVAVLNIAGTMTAV
jgi:hypothetical protein